MPRNRFFHCLTLAAAFFLLWETQASAYETRVVTDHANTPLFQLRFFDQGEEYGNALSETEGEVSTWQLSAAQKVAVTQAVELWADILGPGANNAVPAAITVDTMNEVEGWRQKDLLITRDQAIPLEEDEFFITDLIGLNVVTDEGETLGTLTDVMETGANDVYCVKTPEGKELLLPAIRDCILDVDLDKEEMLVHVLPGLLDL